MTVGYRKPAVIAYFSLPKEQHMILRSELSRPAGLDPIGEKQ